MPDRKTVLTWLEICGKNRDCSACCPYGDGTGEDEMSACRENLMADAFALLKEQQEIVRCNDCAFYADSANCPVFAIDRYDDWFCADGERKET